MIASRSKFWIFHFGLIAWAACADTPQLDEAPQDATTVVAGCANAFGYWKNAPTWPASSLSLGTVRYTAAQLRAILATQPHGNGLVELGHALIAAKLDRAAGANAPALVAAIAAADAIVGGLVVPPIGTGFIAPSTANPVANALAVFETGIVAPAACAPEVDLGIVVGFGESRADVGDTITFRVGVTNIGPATATGVDVTDVLPAGVTFLAATASQGSYDPITGTWVVGTVTTSTQALLLISAIVTRAGQFTNAASLGATDQIDPNPSNDTATITMSSEVADLAILAAVQDTGNLYPGASIVLRAGVYDSGPASATGVIVTEPLPAGLRFVSATTSQGSYDPITGRWAVGTVTTSTPALLDVNAIVETSGRFSSSPSVTFVDQLDPNPDNDTATVTVTSPEADLAITMTADETTPGVAETTTMTITVTNNGSIPATIVEVTDILPAGLQFVSATPSQGSYSPISAVWVVGTVTPATPATLLLRVTPTGPAVSTNTATIAYELALDPVPENNVASVTISPAVAQLGIALSASNTHPNVGDQVVLTLAVTSSGPSTATDVWVSDVLPTGLSLDAAVPSQGTYNPTDGTWAVGTVATRASATMSIYATVTSSLAMIDTASIELAGQFDSNLLDNTASVTIVSP